MVVVVGAVEEFHLLLKGHRNSHFHKSRWFGCPQVVMVMAAVVVVVVMVMGMMMMMILMGRGD